MTAINKTATDTLSEERVSVYNSSNVRYDLGTEKDAQGNDVVVQLLPRSISTVPKRFVEKLLIRYPKILTLVASTINASAIGTMQSQIVQENLDLKSKLAIVNDKLTKANAELEALKAKISNDVA